VRLDNIAIVPASLLPYMTQWQAMANSLAHGETLIVLPSHAKQQHVVRFVASRLREKGRPVKLMDQELTLKAL
jgi:hypothetical protein